MADWQPLSVRTGAASPRGPYEGVPAHISQFLMNWISTVMTAQRKEDVLERAVALRLGIITDDRSSVTAQILRKCQQYADVTLDVVDMLLLITEGVGSEPLRELLALGGSVWTVDENDLGLVRRVSEGERNAYSAAVSPADEISDELITAWGKVYGRHPDPSDAWDHAIKSVELSLWPIVTPDNSKATLGTINAALSKPDAPFAFRLATSSTRSTNLEALVQMLRLMWPNPDRHGTGTSRTPSMDEAVNVVQLAVLLVGWVRTGALESGATT